MKLENPEINLSIVLDTRRVLKSGLYPVKVRITYKRKQKYFRVNMEYTKRDFEKIMATRPRGEFKAAQLKLRMIEDYAIGIINELPYFSFDLFENKFYKRPEKSNDVFKSYDIYIEKLKENGQVSTADTYNLSKNSIKNFVKRESLFFHEITPELLNKYEKQMLKYGKSLTTVSMYLRCLRKIFNDAISKGVIKQDIYPFGKNQYQIPATQNIKKALNLDELNKLYKYQPEQYSTEDYAKDMWFFSYLCNGMNIADIANLKYGDIEDGNKIVFYRKKTISTSRHNLKPIIVYLVDKAKDIIKKWGNRETSENDYIFPVLEEGLSPEKKRAKIKQTTKTINKYMQRIAAKTGIEKNITTYYARHTFSTVLKRSGVSYEFISESLGHHDLRTTENYLDSFEDATKKEYSERLLPFKNE